MATVSKSFTFFMILIFRVCKDFSLPGGPYATLYGRDILNKSSHHAVGTQGSSGADRLKGGTGVSDSGQSGSTRGTGTNYVMAEALPFTFPERPVERHDVLVKSL